ncbi:MAG: pyrroline-5-carboxylate reductase [Bacteroidetes bacterium]|nr:MAG: pyrroline-5-carboxylate reductase [Bacteroidota bacterium]
MKVLIAGAGNMGSTYGASFINANAIRREELCFLDRGTGKAGRLASLSAHPLHTQPGEFVSDFGLIILSVKPQDFPTLAASLKPFIQPGHLILSIMAGVTMKRIAEELGAGKIVRAMPNLPSQVGQGMTVFTASDQVSIKEIFFIQNLLSTTGKTLYTEQESMLDAATAISGSGPAFVYFFMEAMMEAGRQMGFAESETQLLVHQTFLGAVDLLHRNTLSSSEWISRVASKGGTTEAALKIFAQNDLKNRIVEGLEAARARAVELSQ